VMLLVSGCHWPNFKVDCGIVLVKMKLIVVWLIVFITAWLIALLYAVQQACKLLKEPKQRIATVVRNMQKRARSIQMTMSQLLPHLPRVSVCPMSQPKVKFKAHQHSVQSYQLRTSGHCHDAIQSINCKLLQQLAMA